jgi:peptide/nickel transport system substrate-binding protein
MPPQLDPQRAWWLVMQRVYGMVYNQLIRRDWSRNGQFVPGLARSWKRLDDTTIEFELRDDVVFHDGSPLTAEDVAFTFERTLRGDKELSATGRFPIAEVQVLDRHLVRFVTDGPDGAFEHRLSKHEASIVPKAYLEQVGPERFQREPMGTGPYRVVEFVPDQRIVLEAHEEYFEGKPPADRVVVVAIPEVGTRVAALLNGEIDVLIDLPPDQVALVEQAGRFRVDSFAPLNANYLIVNGLKLPTDKVEVRQALSLAIDRRAIVEQLLGGHGLVPGSVQSVLDPLYVERPPLSYDPERARQLLDQAGYAGEEITFVFDSPPYYPMHREWVELMGSMWRAVGLNVTLHGVEVSQRVELQRPDTPYHLINNSTGVEVDIVLYQSYGPNSLHQKLFPPGYFGDFNQILDRARFTVDNQERARLYQQALDIMNERVMAIIQFTINRLQAMPERVLIGADPEFRLDLSPRNFQVRA